MAAEGPNKKGAGSQAVAIHDRLYEPILVRIPVGDEKADEAEALILDLFEVARKHYLRSNKLNPTDVARIMDEVSKTWAAKHYRITEEKYSDRSTRPNN